MLRVICEKQQVAMRPFVTTGVATCYAAYTHQRCCYLLQMDGAAVPLHVDDWSSRGLLDVIRRSLLPPVVEFSREASRLVAISNLLDHVLLFTSRRHDNHAAAVDAFTHAAAAAFQRQVRSLGDYFPRARHRWTVVVRTKLTILATVDSLLQ